MCHLVREARTGIAALPLASTPEHSETGILSSLLATLADSGISVLAVSTYETDYIQSIS